MTRPARLARLALATALLGAAAAPAMPLGAQAPAVTPASRPEPPRPKLRREDDPNDWRSYYAAGAKLMARSPHKAAEAFWWAERYNPVTAEPLYARWVALWRAEPSELSEYLQGAAFVIRAPKTIRRDSVLYEAIAIDPFVGRQFERWLYESQDGEYDMNDPYTAGFIAYSEGRYAEAVKQFGRALQDKRAPWWRLHHRRALAYFAAQQLDSASAELATLSGRMRDEAGKHTLPFYESTAIYDYGIGVAHMRASRLAEARAALMKALEEDLTLAPAHAALARIAIAEGRHDEAVRELQLAVELRPANVVYHADLGTALIKAKQYAEAAAEYEKAVALEPWFSATYFNLAVAREALGEKAEAVRRYREFLDRAPRALAQQITYAEGKLQALGN